MTITSNPKTQTKNQRGIFVTFEGIDASGKTTQISLFNEYLMGHTSPFEKSEVVVTNEPGGTDLGKRLRSEILHGEDIGKRTEALLYLADRADHVESVILKELNEGKIVICDRYIDSTLAYQVGGRGLLEEDINALNKFAAHNAFPDITILLDISVEESQSRLQKRATDTKIKKDRIERADIEFFERVKNKFSEIAKNNPDRVIKVNGSGEKGAISANIISEFNRMLNKKGLLK